MLLNIFVETDTFFEFWVQKFKRTAFICYIINVLTVSFDQFTASLLNKSIYLSFEDFALLKQQAKY